jgi:methylphosphotriester-DNA--protein-cysteine methyltransferase
MAASFSRRRAVSKIRWQFRKRCGAAILEPRTPLPICMNSDSQFSNSPRRNPRWSAKLGEVRAGRRPKPSISVETVEAIVEATLHSKPKGDTHWSTRRMAKQLGVSRSTVQKIWRARVFGTVPDESFVRTHRRRKQCSQ